VDFLLLHSIPLKPKFRVPKMPGHPDRMSHVTIVLTPAVCDRQVRIDAVRAHRLRIVVGMLVILQARVVATMATIMVETLPAYVMTVAEAAAVTTIVNAAPLAEAILLLHQVPMVVVRNGLAMMRPFRKAVLKVWKQLPVVALVF
jgi:hypothetical protein